MFITRSRRPYVACVCWLACLTITSNAAGEIVLVDQGRSDYSIVTREKANRVVRLAAQELQSFVHQATGVKLSITTTPANAPRHVFIGANPWSDKAGVTAADLPDEGFHIRSIGQDIHIVGDDGDRDPKQILTNLPVACGSLTGVYEFLERFLGVMFCWGDELGTVVPHHDRIVIPVIDFTDNPDWDYRVLAYSPNGDTRGIYGRRLRLGHTYSVAHAHSWFRIAPAEKLGASHPEYYALVNGKRTAGYYLGHHGGQVCTSNPEVIEIFAHAAIDYFDRLGWRDMFSISPNDGGGFCQCRRCRALDPMPDAATSDPPFLTDRLITFYNAVAERLAAKHPDKLLGAYIYSYYKRPPVRVKPHPNLFLVHATNSGLNHGATWAEENQWEQAWAHITRRLYKYDIYYLSRPALNLIAPVTTHIIEKIKAEHDNGLRGAYLYIGQSYEQLGAGHYLMARLMWDRKADARALETKYYSALYGPAGDTVRDYYHLLESRLRKVYLQGADVDEPAVRKALLLRSAGGSQGAILAAYWPVLDQASALLQQAGAQTLTDRQRLRLQRLQDQHELLVTTVRGFIAAGRLETQALFRDADVRMLRDAVQRREAVKRKLADYAPTLAARVEDGDKTVTAPVSRDGAFYQLARAAGPTEIACARAPRSPHIDGFGKEPLWRAAPAQRLLDVKSAQAPALGARTRLLRDDSSLYLLVESRGPEGVSLIANAAGDDDLAIFSDDNVEVFLQPPEGGYYHLALSASGAVYSARHPDGSARNADTRWNPAVTAAVARGQHGWSAEMAVPWSAVGGPPQPGKPWRINVYRTRRAGAEPDAYLGVAPTFSGYHVPSKFAILRIDKASIAGFPDGGFDALTPADITKRLRVQARGSATVTLDEQTAYCGRQSVHFHVPADALAGITLTTGVAARQSYRFTYACRARRETESEKPVVVTRVIFYRQDWSAATPTTGYSWDRTPASQVGDRWRLGSHTVKTPEGCARVGLTFFFSVPGDYWLDEVQVEGR